MFPLDIWGLWCQKQASQAWISNRIPQNTVGYNYFLHDRPGISPWIKSISNELNITIHVIASQLSDYCDVINNRLWRHQQNVDPVSEARGRCVKIVVFIIILSSLCRVKNKIMYVLSSQTVSALTRVLFCRLFPSCFATREINNKITPSWALKQFVTPVHLSLPEIPASGANAFIQGNNYREL